LEWCNSYIFGYQTREPIKQPGYDKTAKRFGKKGGDLKPLAAQKDGRNTKTHAISDERCRTPDICPETKPMTLIIGGII
jgi:hypothetical protein